MGAKIEIRRSEALPSYDFVVLETVDTHNPLRSGDLLRQFDGQPLKHRADLMNLLRRDCINRDVSVVIERDGKSQTLSVTPQQRLE